MSDMNALMIPDDQPLARPALPSEPPADTSGSSAGETAPDADYLERVRVAAYYIAEKYQFLRDPALDWDEAEAQIKSSQNPE